MPHSYRIFGAIWGVYQTVSDGGPSHLDGSEESAQIATARFITGKTGHQKLQRRGDPLTVPLEVAAFGLLAICVIQPLGILFVNLVFPRNAAIFAPLLVPALVVVAALAIYVLITTRTR